jgi:hypothetical protein
MVNNDGIVTETEVDFFFGRSRRQQERTIKGSRQDGFKIVRQESLPNIVRFGGRLENGRDSREPAYVLRSC